MKKPNNRTRNRESQRNNYGEEIIGQVVDYRRFIIACIVHVQKFVQEFPRKSDFTVTVTRENAGTDTADNP